jgi:hypothetical protein
MLISAAVHGSLTQQTYLLPIREIGPEAHSGITVADPLDDIRQPIELQKTNYLGF